ncbi:unnamed protein product, partial [Cladocopium goreaui]
VQNLNDITKSLIGNKANQKMDAFKEMHAQIWNADQRVSPNWLQFPIAVGFELCWLYIGLPETLGELSFYLRISGECGGILKHRGQVPDWKELKSSGLSLVSQVAAFLEANLQQLFKGELTHTRTRRTGQHLTLRERFGIVDSVRTGKFFTLPKALLDSKSKAMSVALLAYWDMVGNSAKPSPLLNIGAYAPPLDHDYSKLEFASRAIEHAWDIESFKWVESVTSHSHSPCLFGDILGMVPINAFDATDGYNGKLQGIMNCNLSHRTWCIGKHDGRSVCREDPFMFHKPTLQKSLKDDYLKLKSPMKDITFTELVQKVEIELSKNQKFEVLELRTGEQMLSCKGIVKPLGPASDGKTWMIRKSAQGIPFVTDGVKSRWCMTVFQDHAPKTSSIEEAAELPSLEVTETILAESRDANKNSNDSTRAELPGVSPQVGKLEPDKSMKAVCHCGKGRAECPDCKAGYNQEVAAGRAPKLVNPGSDDENLVPLQDSKDADENDTKKPSRDSDPDAPKPLIKKVPVCACQEQREVCPDCGKGFLEVVKKGELPLFKEIEIATKRVAICDCGEHRAECTACNAGFMTVMLKGKTPKFKVVPVDPSDNPTGTGNTTPAPLPAPAATASPEVPSPEVPKEPQNAAAPATDDVAEKGGAVAADAGKEGSSAVAIEPPAKKPKVEPGTPSATASTTAKTPSMFESSKQPGKGKPATKKCTTDVTTGASISVSQCIIEYGISPAWHECDMQGFAFKSMLGARSLANDSRPVRGDALNTSDRTGILVIVMNSTQAEGDGPWVHAPRARLSDVEDADEVDGDDGQDVDVEEEQVGPAAAPVDPVLLLHDFTKLAPYWVAAGDARVWSHATYWHGARKKMTEFAALKEAVLWLWRVHREIVPTHT